ncbi:MAG: tRNA uridine-5-carboxymethylaminomethyl(34) synthesis GTPase MnmE [Myxococcaceae bacterium]
MGGDNETATIAAVATGASRGGVAVVRVSGPRALEAALALTQVERPPKPRYAYLTPVRTHAGQLLDEGLFLYFAAPHSLTGEEVVELQLHGNWHLAQAVLREVLSTPGVRMAQPGEFTRRAFLNGRMDLARAEAVGDLVLAESEAAQRAAAAQLCGELSARIKDLRTPLLALCADVEGVLNFPDEAEGAAETLAPRIAQLAQKARAMLGEAKRGRLLRDGARVVIFGPPNAGKSSIFNRLCGDSRALVDAEPGTTRDALEARLLLFGCAVTVVDTAGLRETNARVEALGVDKAREEIRRADVAVLVLPPDAREAEAELWEAEATGASLLRVRSKADLVPLEARTAQGQYVSAVTQEGIDALREHLGEELGIGGHAEWAGAISGRHADALSRVSSALDSAAEAERLSTLEVVAGELHDALLALGEITGETATQEVLDAIFARFCIGK